MTTGVRKIVIVDYRPEWAEEFVEIVRPIKEAFGELALRIDHIGSTSVPGLAAKSVGKITRQVIVQTAEVLSAAIP